MCVLLKACILEQYLPLLVYISRIAETTALGNTSCQGQAHYFARPRYVVIYFFDPARIEFWVGSVKLWWTMEVTPVVHNDTYPANPPSQVDLHGTGSLHHWGLDGATALSFARAGASFMAVGARSRSWPKRSRQRRKFARRSQT